GGNADLVQLFPALAAEGERERTAPRGDPAEIKSRLHWTLAQLVTKLAAKQPMLLVLENLQWADASSLELLHFVARQLTAEQLVRLGARGARPAAVDPRRGAGAHRAALARRADDRQPRGGDRHARELRRAHLGERDAGGDAARGARRVARAARAVRGDGERRG